jgi:NAD(P)H-quinone oxidoreductase subunit N
MALFTTGKSFIRDLEKSGAVGVYTPLEGGSEGRYQRRLRAAGYATLNITARGLGDLSSYLMGVHGVRPAHLGKKNIAQAAQVGPVYFIPPIAGYNLETLANNSKGLVLWIIEGHVLSRQEVEYLIELTKQKPKLKVVLEMGGQRYFDWKPLVNTLKVR